jgi:outer membrane protein assembly factor BamC
MRYYFLRYLKFTPVLLVIFLTACGSSGSARQYLDVTLGKPLEMPPDLARLEGDSSFDLPEGITGDSESSPDKVPVLARVESLQLQGSPGFYWLSVDEPVENLYQQVKNFWAFEGYELNVDEPVIGIMETEWIYKEEGAVPKNISWWNSLFVNEDLSASQDQFQTRIERDQSGGSNNRIYITHRGTEYVHEFRADDRDDFDSADSEWSFRRPEPQLEVEMLSRLMVYLGLDQESITAQFEQPRLFKPRVSLELDAEEKSSYLLLRDPYQIAWNRLNHVLQRLNFEILSSEFKSGFSGEGVFIVKSNVVETVVDEGFFGIGSSEKNISRNFILVVSEENHEVTRVIIEDEKGNFDSTPEGAEFLSLLFEQLK